MGGVVKFEYVNQDGDVSDSRAFFEKCFKETIQRSFSKCHPYARVVLYNRGDNISGFLTVGYSLSGFIL